MQKKSETSKIFETPERDLEAIEIVGSRHINELQIRYTPAQLRLIEERAKVLKSAQRLRQRLSLWESGLFAYLVSLTLFLGASTVTCWVFYKPILELFSRFIGGLTPRIALCLTVNSVIITALRVVDVGRMVRLFFSHKKEDEKEELDQMILARYDVGELGKNNAPKKGSTWLSATEIADSFAAEVEPRLLGKKLIQMGFKTQRKANKRAFLVKKPEFLNLQKND